MAPASRSEQERCRRALPFLLVAEQPGDEVLDARAEGVGAVLEARPGVLGLWLRGLGRFLQLLAAVLRALNDGVADTLGRLLGPGADLAVPNGLGAFLDLARSGLHLGVVGGKAVGGEARDDHGGYGDHE